LLDNQPLTNHFGKFEQMKDGSELRTEAGRAEVMLTPGVFLRMGQNSIIRMMSNRLADTRVEFLGGSAVLDSMAALPAAPITMVYGGYQVRVQTRGRYRFDSDPAELRVEKGETEVLCGSGSQTVSAGGLVPLSEQQLVTRQFANETSDSLDTWSRVRSDSILETNTATGAADLSTVVDNWQDDPDALLRALMSNYVPPSSSLSPSYGYAPLPGSTPRSIYSPLSTSSPLSIYSPLAGNPALGIMPFGIWGLGFPSPLGIYSSPLLRYSYPSVGLPSYRSPVISGRPVTGVSPIHPSSPRPLSPVSPIHAAPSHIGHR
jgi:hypothetical protein